MQTISEAKLRLAAVNLMAGRIQSPADAHKEVLKSDFQEMHLDVFDAQKALDGGVQDADGTKNGVVKRDGQKFCYDGDREAGVSLLEWSCELPGRGRLALPLPHISGWTN